MATIEVTAPNGRKIRIQAPEGATEAEVQRYVAEIARTQPELGLPIPGMPEQAAAPAEEEGPGFAGAIANAGVRAGGRTVGLTEAYQSERLTGAAAAQEEMARRETAGEMSWLDRVATWRPSWAAPLETPDELRGLAADRVVSQAQRDQRLAEQFPMSERGARGVENLAGAETFSEALGVVARQPLDVLAGVAEVGLEQAPTLAAAAAGTLATRNPNVGMGIMSASSYAQERFGQMSTEAQSFGYDLTDPADARRAVADEEFMAAQQARGETRGSVIALVDALTFRAGSMFNPASTRGLVANAGLQVGGGASGEALAQLATDGEISSPGEVVLEGLAEGPFSAVELGISRVGRDGPEQTGTDLDALLAAEEAALAAEARQQEETQAAAQDVEMRETRLDFAPTFVSESDYVAQQQEAVRRDATNTDTDTGKAYRQYLLDNDILPTNPQEETSAVNAFVKQTLGAQDRAATSEQYRSAMDEHIGRMRDLETVLTAEPAAEQQLEMDLEPPAADTEVDQAPADTAVDQGLADTAALAPENQDGQLEMDLRQPSVAEPEVPADVVRMYHGGALGGTNTWTSDRPRAEAMANGGDMNYVDIPKTDDRLEAAATNDFKTTAEFTLAAEDLAALGGANTLQVAQTAAQPDPTTMAVEIIKATGVQLAPQAEADISARMAQIVAMPTAERVAATRALVANYTTPQKKATGRTPAAPQPAAQKPAPQPQVARVPDPITMETPVRRRPDGQAKAEALLPADWTEDARYDNVASALNGTKFNIKKFNDALAAALNPQEETQADPQADPQAETPTTPSGEAVSAPQSVPTTFVDDPELRTTLSNQQASVYDAMLAAANEGRLSDIFTVSWSAPTEQDGSNYTRRKAEQKRGRTKVLKDAGVTDKALLRRLFPEKPTPANPEPPLSQKVRMLREAGVGENVVELFQKVKLPERVEEKDSSAGWQVEADTKRLAAAAGIKNPGSAKTQISAVMRKVRERYGDEGFRRMLADTGALGEGSGLGDTTSMAEAVEAGLVTAQTTGQSQTGGASAKGKVQATGDERQRLKAAGVKQSEIDKWFGAGNAAAAAENDQTQVLLDQAQQDEDFAVKQADRMLRAKWAESNPTDIAYDDLSDADKRMWMKAVYENIDLPTTDALESLQQTAQGIADSVSPDEEVATDEGQQEQGDQGGRAEVRTADGNQGDTNLPQNDGGGRTADSGPADSGSANGPEAGTQEAGQPDTGVIGQARSAPLVEARRKRRKLNKPDGTKRFSRVTGSNAKRTSKDRITELLKQTFNPSVTPGNLYSRIQVFSTVDEATKALRGMFTREELSTTQAVVSPDGSRVFVVAENIPEGQELSVILHDLGVHVGLEGLLGGGDFDSLVTAVQSWEYATADTVERQVWEAATARVAFARTLAPMDEDLAGVELVAYAAEEAARLGVTPTAEEQNTVAKWLHDVGEFVAKVLQRALGFSGEEFQLTAGELVAFAFGAAEQAMNQAVVETGAVSGATDEQIAAYYSGLNSESELTGTEELFVADPSQYSNGEELFVWGDGSTFGEFTDIITEGELFTQFDGRKSMQLYLTSAESRAEAEKVTDPENGSDSDALLVVTASQTIEHPNVWDLSIFGPDPGTAAFEVARKRGVVSRTRGTDGDTWSRLEGIPRRDTVRVLAEARRRLTRMQEGLVPNVVFTRATGIAALTTQDGRDGFVRDADVRKRFSRVSPAKQGADQESQVANPQGAQQNASRTERFLEKTFGGARSAQIVADTKAIFRKPLDATKFLHQFIDENRQAMPSAGKWYDAMLAQEQTVNEILGRAEPIVLAYRELKAERQALVNDFIGSSTFYQKWGYDPKWANKTVKVDPTMRTKFDRLTAEEQQIARDIFQHGEDMRVEMQNLAKQLGVPPKMFSMNSKLDGPYAPLKRFGNNVAVLRSQQLADMEARLRQNTQDKKLAKDIEKMKGDGAHYVVSFFDSIGAAEKFAYENRQNYPVNEVSEKAPDAFGDRITNPEAFAKVISAVKADSKSGLDDSTRQAVTKIVEQLYYESLGEQNARLSGARRLNRAGYEKDMVRSFMSHLQAQARLVAQLKHGADINTAFAEAQREAGRDRRRLQPVFNMIARKYNHVLSTDRSFLTSVQDNIAAFNTVYMLTSNIGYHVANATQPMISVAKIAGDFGKYPGAWSALVRGYKNSRHVVNSSIFRQAASALTVGFVDMNNKVEIDISKAPPKYRKLLETLQLRQLLDVGMEEDLNLENRFDTGYGIVNKASEGFSNMTHRLYQVARYVEAHNRVASAIAAYDMAQANPAAARRMKMTPEEYAISVVQDTQGNFSSFDAPLLVDALPKLTTQFRKFQLMMAWLYGNAFKQAWKGADKYEKAAGRRTLFYLAAHASALSGAAGIPLVSSLASLILSNTGDEEEPEDLERYVREKMFPDNDRMADLVTRGVPAFFGVDMSTKLTQGDIFTPVNLQYIDSEPSAQGARNVVVQAVFGPTAGVISNMGRAAQFLSEGDILRGTEYLVPRGVRSMLETYRYANEGYTLNNGDVVLDPREIDVSSLLLNAIGLPPEEVSQLRWTYGQQYELRQWFSNESGRLRSDYVEAHQARDREAMANLRLEWRDLQESKDRVRPFFNNSRNAPQRQPVTDLMSAPREQQRRESRYRDALGTNR